MQKKTILLCLGVCGSGVDITDVYCVVYCVLLLFYTLQCKNPPCLPGEKAVLWLRLRWFVVLGRWHNRMRSLFFPSLMEMYICSLFV